MKDLKNIPERNPFKVPENYFENVNRKIIESTSGSRSASDKPVIRSRFRSVLLMAASFTGFLIISYFTVKLLLKDNSDIQLSDFTANDITEQFINEFDIYTIEANSDSETLYTQIPDVTKNDIIDYLLMENIGIDEIYEQL